MKTYAKSGILAAAQGLDVTPNTLGARLGYINGPAAAGLSEAEAKFLLCPFAICCVAQRFPDETVFSTNVLSRGNGCVFSGEENNNVTLGEPTPYDEAAAELLRPHFAGNDPTATGVNIPLAPAQAAVLLALADALRRRRISCLLTGRIADLAFTLEDITREMDFAAAENDLRWLLPFLQNAAGETLLDDSTLPAALASFADSPLLSVSKNGEIALTQSGGQIIDALSRADAFLSATSVFYDNDAQAIMVVLLLGGGGCEFYLELSARGFLCTCDDDGALAALATMLAPGDVPGFDAPPAPVPAPAEKKPAAKAKRKPAKEEPAKAEPVAEEKWQCTCGRVNTGKFCAACGEPKPAPVQPLPDGSWQCTCGRVNTGKFCAACGEPKPAPAPRPAADGSWQCPTCGRVNKGAFCPKCGAKRP